MLHHDMLTGHRTDIFARFRIAVALIGPRNRPRTRERVVDRRNLVAQDVAIVLVEADALLDDGRAVRVERSAV
jgi:hypothetical protein